MVLGAVRSTVRIVPMATYGTNARVSDIVCRCCRVCYGVGVLVKSLTTILRKLDAEDFTSEKLLRHFGIQRQIESFPARPCVRMFCSCHSRLTLYCYDNCGCCYHNKCFCCGQFAPQQPRLPKCSGTEIVRICTRISP